MSPMRPFLAVPAVFALANCAWANVAIHIYPDSPQYERARLAEQFFWPVLLCASISIVLFWTWVRRRTGSFLARVALIATIVLLLGTAFVSVFGSALTVMHHDSPASGEGRFLSP